MKTGNTLIGNDSLYTLLRTKYISTETIFMYEKEA